MRRTGWTATGSWTRPRGVLQPRHTPLVRGSVRRTDGGAAAGLGAHCGGRTHTAHRAHGQRQDAGGVPVRDRPAHASRRCRRGARRARAVRLAAEGAGIRHRPQPARAAGRHPSGGWPSPARAAPAACSSTCVRTGDTPVGRPPPAGSGTPARSWSPRRSRSSCILGSAARETLRTVRWVIVDEVHAVAATKRGAHLSLSWSG
jgi:hypothetical protein